MKLENGKLSFTTKDFFDYSAVLVPEPSMFGLMAGLGALLLVGTRRRRK
ncbi:MAG: PEP-CTERM sorting domain-containing protein [Opitutales bacterium]|nr:PEP-CTERM sorting domain-containing protein [Opitutales bacterium]